MPDTYYRPAGVLGKYKSKERALEVLDEIENIIIEIQVASVTSSVLTLVNDETKDKLIEAIERLEKVSVYEMPKE